MDSDRKVLTGDGKSFSESRIHQKIMDLKKLVYRNNPPQNVIVQRTRSQEGGERSEVCEKSLEEKEDETRRRIFSKIKERAITIKEPIKIKQKKSEKVKLKKINSTPRSKPINLDPIILKDFVPCEFSEVHYRSLTKRSGHVFGAYQPKFNSDRMKNGGALVYYTRNQAFQIFKYPDFIPNLPPPCPAPPRHYLPPPPPNTTPTPSPTTTTTSPTSPTRPPPPSPPSPAPPPPPPCPPTPATTTPSPTLPHVSSSSSASISSSSASTSSAYTTSASTLSSTSSASMLSSTSSSEFEDIFVQDSLIQMTTSNNNSNTELEPDNFLSENFNNNKGEPENVDKPKCNNENFYPCALCDYKATKQCNLKRHVERVHKISHEKQYPCAHCDYKTPKESNLKRHSERIHTENKKPVKSPVNHENDYPCDHCDYTATKQCNLKRHVIAKHTETKLEYACSQCDYQSTKKTNVERHSRRVHTK